MALYLCGVLYFESASMKVCTIHSEDSIMSSFSIFESEKCKFSLSANSMSSLIALYFKRDIHVSDAPKLLEYLSIHKAQVV